MVSPSDVIKISSPNGTVELLFKVGDKNGNGSSPYYAITHTQQPLVNWSRLGLKLRRKRNLAHFTLLEVRKSSHEEEWTPLYGERSRIPNNYNEITLFLKETSPKKRTRHLQIIFRVFNEGIAFRYYLPPQKYLRTFTITDENTRFAFPPNAWCYQELHYEGKYKFLPLAETKPRMERPLTVVLNPETDDEKFMVITDANVIDYSPFRLNPVFGKSNNLKVSLGASHKVVYPGRAVFRPKHPFDVWRGQVKGATPFSTAWRVILIGDTPGDLIERNYLIQNLCDPTKIENCTWIKPGKVIRDTLMTNESGRKYIDFAAKYGLDYVHWDAGWYGPEYRYSSDPATVSVDRKKYPLAPGQPEFDFHSIIKYAKEKGIGVWVYVNYRHLELYLDKILPLYKKWGIDGIKFGFVRYGPHQCQKWLIDAVRKCADHGIMVDIHDAYRPSGIERTYPNLLTQEGIRGNEHRPTAAHSCTVPFTRFSTGAADFTISYYSNRIQTTHAHQLAISIIFYSPLQFLFWYDNPAHAADEPELEFFGRLPTVWDITKVIDGKIGKFITIARKKGSSWFVGAITNEKSRKKEISLDFLDSGIEYNCVIYHDDLAVKTTTQVGITLKKFHSTDILTVNLSESGGVAVILDPAYN